MNCIIKPTDLKQFSSKVKECWLTHQHLTHIRRYPTLVECWYLHCPQEESSVTAAPAVLRDWGQQGFPGHVTWEGWVSGSLRPVWEARSMWRHFCKGLRNLFSQEPSRMALRMLSPFPCELPFHPPRSSWGNQGPVLTAYVAVTNAVLPQYCSPGNYQQKRRLFFPTENFKHVKTNFGSPLQRAWGCIK